MISFLTSWAEQIIVAIIIIILFEMIIPEGTNKKYIKVVMGVFVLYMIINPLLSKLSKGIDLDKVIKNSDENLINTTTIPIDSNIEEMYKTNIENSIIASVNEKGYEVKSIDTEIDYKDSYGIIKKIVLKINKNSNEIVAVQEVNINSTTNNNNNNTNNIEESEINSLKEFLSNSYSVNKENIIIGG